MVHDDITQWTIDNTGNYLNLGHELGTIGICMVQNLPKDQTLIIILQLYHK